MQLHLSDAYKSLPGAPGLGGSLELSVRVLNINLGHNQEIIERCKKLHGYVRFIAEVRRSLSAGLTLTDAVTQATFVCSKEEYIPDFLKEHGSEVLNWMTLIYDQKEAERYIREEGIAKGREEGREEGIVNILLSLINDNYPMSAIRNLADKHGISDEKINQLIASTPSLPSPPTPAYDNHN
jgi:hypothetical protein